jgi:hypothetical protein
MLRLVRYRHFRENMNMESQSQTLYHKTIRLVDNYLFDHGGDQKGLFYPLILSSVNFPTYRIEQRVRHSVLSTHHTTVITIVSSILPFLFHCHFTVLHLSMILSFCSYCLYQYIINSISPVFNYSNSRNSEFSLLFLIKTTP